MMLMMVDNASSTVCVIHYTMSDVSHLKVFLIKWFNEMIIIVTMRDLYSTTHSAGQQHSTAITY